MGMYFATLRQQMLWSFFSVFVPAVILIIGCAIFLSHENTHELAEREQNIHQEQWESLYLQRVDFLAQALSILLNKPENEWQSWLGKVVNQNDFMEYILFLPNENSKRLDKLNKKISPWSRLNDRYKFPESDVSNQLNEQLFGWSADLDQPKSIERFFLGNKVREYGAPIISQDKLVGFLSFAISERLKNDRATQLESDQHNNLFVIFLFLLLIAAVITVIAYVMIHRFSLYCAKPLIQLSSVARQMTRGGDHAPIRVDSVKEIEALAYDFNYMASMLQYRLQDMSLANEVGEKLITLAGEHSAIEYVIHVYQARYRLICAVTYLAEDNNIWVRKLHALSEDWKILDQEIISEQDAPRFVELCVKASGRYQVVFRSNFQLKGHILDLLVIPLVEDSLLTGMLVLIAEGGQMEYREHDIDFISSVSHLLLVTINSFRLRQTVQFQNKALEIKIKERTEVLYEKATDIFNIMKYLHEGVCIIAKDLTVYGDYSTYLESVFEQESLSGANIVDLLLSHADVSGSIRHTLETTLQSLIEFDAMFYECNQHLLPKEIRILFDYGQREKILELEWDPIVLNKKIEKILLIVTDVTEKRHQAEEKRRFETELAIMHEMLSVGVSRFSLMLLHSDKIVKINLRLIETHQSSSAELLELLIRNLRTVRAEAVNLGFVLIVQSMDEALAEYHEEFEAMQLIGADEDGLAWNASRLVRATRSVLVTISDYQRVYNEKAELTGFGRMVPPKLLTEVQSCLEAVSQSSQLSEDEITRISKCKTSLSQLHYHSFEDIIRGVRASLPTLASAYGHETPQLEAIISRYRFEDGMARLLQEVLSQVIRSLVVKAAELPLALLSEPDSEQRKINIEALPNHSGLTMVVESKPLGLCLDDVRQDAIEAGRLSQDSQLPVDQLANLVFSAKPRELHHRQWEESINMMVLKSFLKSKGGDIHLALKSSEASMSEPTPFAFHIDIPKDSFVFMN